MIRTLGDNTLQDLRISADGSWIAATSGRDLLSFNTQANFLQRSFDRSGSNWIDSFIGVNNSGQLIFSSSVDLVGTGDAPRTQIFSLDSATGLIQRRSGFSDDLALNAIGLSYTLSGDGTTVSILSDYSPLGEGSTGLLQLYQLDLATGLTARRTRFTSDQFSTSGITGSYIVAGDGSRVFYARSGSASIRGIYEVDVRSEDARFDFEAGFGSSGNILARLSGIDRTLRGLNAHTLSSQVTARNALEDLRFSLAALGESRGAIGASMSRITSALSLSTTQSTEVLGAASRIQDADVALEAARLVQSQIQQQVAASLLGQANQQSRIALLLLQTT